MTFRKLILCLIPDFRAAGYPQRESFSKSYYRCQHRFHKDFRATPKVIIHHFFLKLINLLNRHYILMFD